MRTCLIAIASGMLVLLALCELALAWPVVGWLYLSGLAVLAAGLIQPTPLRNQTGRIALLIAAIVACATLWRVDWSTRKPFLRDLQRIRVGMTEAEVRRIMGQYREGTGWPAIPGVPHDKPALLATEESGFRHPVETPPPGQLILRDSLVFRHSDRGAFNSDWGIVTLSDDRVIGVEFSPD